jgi:hypothetical protein
MEKLSKILSDRVVKSQEEDEQLAEDLRQAIDEGFEPVMEVLRDLQYLESYDFFIHHTYPAAVKNEYAPAFGFDGWESKKEYIDFANEIFKRAGWDIDAKEYVINYIAKNIEDYDEDYDKYYDEDYGEVHRDADEEKEWRIDRAVQIYENWLGIRDVVDILADRLSSMPEDALQLYFDEVWFDWDDPSFWEMDAQEYIDLAKEHNLYSELKSAVEQWRRKRK